MVILYKNKPIGLFIGRLDTNISKFSVPIKLYVYTFRFIFQKIMKLEISDVGQFIFINILKNQKYKQYWIEIVFVDKAHRRFNLASIALDKYINKVPQNCEIWVDTRKHNQSALRFYTKNEFNIRYNIANILILKRQKI
jgi:GNAT superfamily N-acetyltransferase